MRNRQIIPLLFLSVTLIFIVGCKEKGAKEVNIEEGNPIVEITTDFGTIKMELFAKEAPKTVANFVKLVNDGFYNGLIFHRVIPGFMIQGGDPEGTGRGGPGYTIPAEISPTLKHKRGTVACARLGDQVNPSKASSGSQFYICVAPQPHLDGQYTIFGQVIEGMDVVDKIASVDRDRMDKPLKDVVMKKVEIIGLKK